jgi:hypothetical protein
MLLQPRPRPEPAPQPGDATTRRGRLSSAGGRRAYARGARKIAPPLVGEQPACSPAACRRRARSARAHERTSTCSPTANGRVLATPGPLPRQRRLSPVLGRIIPAAAGYPLAVRVRVGDLPAWGTFPTGIGDHRRPLLSERWVAGGMRPHPRPLRRTLDPAIRAATARSVPRLPSAPSSARRSRRCMPPRW